MPSPRAAAPSTLGSLIRLAAPFGLTERLVRTSVARLARDGWLAARRSGPRSEYRLTRRGAARFAEATRRIYGAGPRQWDGRWTLLLLPPGPQRTAAARGPEVARVRPAATRRCSPIRATARARRARALQRPAGRAPTALLLASRSADARAATGGSPRRAGTSTDLARRYQRFVRALRAARAACAAASCRGGTAFLVRTLLIHEYRKVHLQDPLLPPALLPEAWVGAAAYALCRRLYARVFAPAELYLSASAHRLHRPLPAAGAAARHALRRHRLAVARRRSTTRRALPAERSIEPGAPTSTSVVMPMPALMPACSSRCRRCWARASAASSGRHSTRTASWSRCPARVSSSW